MVMMGEAICQGQFHLYQEGEPELDAVVREQIAQRAEHWSGVLMVTC